MFHWNWKGKKIVVQKYIPLKTEKGSNTQCITWAKFTAKQSIPDPTLWREVIIKLVNRRECTAGSTWYTVATNTKLLGALAPPWCNQFWYELDSVGKHKWKISAGDQTQGISPWQDEVDSVRLWFWFQIASAWLEILMVADVDLHLEGNVLWTSHGKPMQIFLKEKIEQMGQRFSSSVPHY